MTVTPSKTARKLQMVEFFSDQIRVSYSDGSLEIDANVQEEAATGKSAGVDIFIRPKEFPDNNVFIVSQERFRSQAALWGPVRGKLGLVDERQAAQEAFNYAESRARMVLGDFSEAVRQGQVFLRKAADRRSFELAYRDPKTRQERIFWLYGGSPTDGNSAFTSLSLEEEDRVRVSVSDGTLLAPLRSRLQALYREWLKKNPR